MRKSLFIYFYFERRQSKLKGLLFIIIYQKKCCINYNGVKEKNCINYDRVKEKNGMNYNGVKEKSCVNYDCVKKNLYQL